MTQSRRWLIGIASIVLLTSTTHTAQATPSQATSTALAPIARSTPAQAASTSAATFYNPIADVEDPGIVTDGGYYYLVGTNNSTHDLTVRKSSTLAGLSESS